MIIAPNLTGLTAGATHCRPVGPQVIPFPAAGRGTV